MFSYHKMLLALALLLVLVHSRPTWAQEEQQGLRGSDSLKRSDSMMTFAPDILDSINAEDLDDAVHRLESHAEKIGVEEDKRQFHLPKCSQSKWGRIAVFLAYRKGKLPYVGAYNHILLVLAPATPSLYLKGPRAHPDGAYVYELTGTPIQALAHATVLGRTISTTVVSPLKGFPTVDKVKFMFVGYSECKQGLQRESEAEGASDSEWEPWRKWEESSGIGFVNPWHHTAIELKLKHSEIFKIQRKVGVPFRALLNALSPGGHNMIGKENHKRYNFATFNCGHYARELLTSAFGIEEGDAQQLMLKDLKDLGFPRKWHTHTPFSFVNPRMTKYFEKRAGFGKGKESGAKRFRCLKKPGDNEDNVQKDLLDNNFACYEAWQDAPYSFDGDSGVQKIFGGWKQFFDEEYGEVWIQSEEHTPEGQELKQKLKKLVKEGKDPRTAAELVSPMGKKVNFAVHED